MLAQIISNVAGQFDYCTDYFPRIKKKSLIYTIVFSLFSSECSLYLKYSK